MRLRAGIEPVRFVQRGRDVARPAPGVAEAIAAADVVFFAPSNPVVSIGTMTGFPGGQGREGMAGIPGIAEAVRSSTAPVVGISPIISDAVIRGMGDVCLQTLGHPVSAVGVALAYGSRTRSPAMGLLDGWLMDSADAEGLSEVTGAGIAATATGLWMTTNELALQVAADALSLSEALRR